MQISLKLIRLINHTKITVCIKFQLFMIFSSLFTDSSITPALLRTYCSLATVLCIWQRFCRMRKIILFIGQPRSYNYKSSGRGRMFYVELSRRAWMRCYKDSVSLSRWERRKKISIDASPFILLPQKKSFFLNSSFCQRRNPFPSMATIRAGWLLFAQSVYARQTLLGKVRLPIRRKAINLVDL